MHSDVTEVINLLLSPRGNGKYPEELTPSVIIHVCIDIDLISLLSHLFSVTHYNCSCDVMAVSV